MSVEPFLRGTGVVPSPGVGGGLDGDTQRGHDVVEAADAAVGSHQQAGREHLIATVEHASTGTTNAGHAEQVEVGELHPAHVRNRAQDLELVGRGDRLRHLREVVHQERKLTPLGQCLVIAAHVGKRVRRRCRRHARDRVGPGPGRMSRERQRFVDRRGADMHDHVPPGRRARDGRVDDGLAIAARQQHALASRAAHVDAVDTGGIDPFQESLEHGGDEAASVIERSDRSRHDAAKQCRCRHDG
jgi:hypothetical protein